MNARTHISVSIPTWHQGRPAIIALLCLRPQALDPPQSVMTRFSYRIIFLDRVSENFPKLCLREIS